jgi:hypothetical protein
VLLGVSSWPSVLAKLLRELGIASLEVKASAPYVLELLIDCSRCQDCPSASVAIATQISSVSEEITLDFLDALELCCPSSVGD